MKSWAITALILGMIIVLAGASIIIVFIRRENVEKPDAAPRAAAEPAPMTVPAAPSTPVVAKPPPPLDAQPNVLPPPAFVLQDIITSVSGTESIREQWQFGDKVALNGDQLVVTSAGFKSNSALLHAVSYDGDSYTVGNYEQKETGDLFGDTVQFSTSGKWLLVTAPNATVDGITGAGQVHIYQSSPGVINLQTPVSLINPTGVVTNDGFGTQAAFDVSETFLFAVSKGMGTSGPWVFVFQYRGNQWQHVDSIRASGFSTDNNPVFAQRVLTLENGELFLLGPGDTTTKYPQMLRVFKNKKGPWMQEWANRWSTLARFVQDITFNKTGDFGILVTNTDHLIEDEQDLYTIVRDDKDGKWIATNQSTHWVQGRALHGTSLAMTENGRYVVVNSPNATFGGKTNAGEVWVFRRMADNTLANQQFLTFPLDKLFPWDNTYFGKSVAITQAEEGEIKIYVGVPGVGLRATPAADRNGYGAVCVYSMQVDSQI